MKIKFIYGLILSIVVSFSGCQDPTVAKIMEQSKIASNPVALRAYVKAGRLNEEAAGETILERAIIDNQYESVKYLISQGANVNRRDHFGSTPIMSAALVGNVKMVKLLVDHGADISQKNQLEMNVIDYALMGFEMPKIERMVAFFLEKDVYTDYKKKLSEISNDIERYKKYERQETNPALKNAYQSVLEKLYKKLELVKGLMDPSYEIYQALKKSPTIEGYEQFIHAYPDAPVISHAKEALDNLRFEKSKELGTIKAYESFLDTYPRSSHVDAVKALIRTLTDEEASKVFGLIKNDDYAGYERFLSHYPYASKAQDARMVLLDYKYAQVKKEDTLKAYASFQKLFPDSKYTQEIENRLAYLEQRAIVDTITAYLQKKDIEGFITYVNSSETVTKVAKNIPQIALLLTGPKKLLVVKVLQYKKQGLGDAILASKIRSIGEPYKDFTLDEVSSLKKFGISETLLAAMLDVTTEHKKEQARKLEQQTLIAKQEAIAKGMQEAQAKTLKQMQEQNAQNAQMQMQQSSGRSVGDILIEKGKEKMVDKLLDSLF